MVFFFKQKTAYEMRISDWSSDVCSSDLLAIAPAALPDDGSRACRAVADQASRQARRPCLHVDHRPADGAGRPQPPFPRMGCPSLVDGVRMDQDDEEFRHDPAREDAALRRGPQIGRASCRERVCKYV